MLDNYDVYLFDFDGLLINTEKLHYQAYQEAMKRCNLPQKLFEHFTFTTFCLHGHTSSTGLKNYFMPHLEEPWETFYTIKTNYVLHELEHGSIPMMPGASAFLEKLKTQKKKMIVVTHSLKTMTEKMMAQHTPLKWIDAWITREDYQEAKPSSQCYHLAIEKFVDQGEKVIGFEDSPKGYLALKGSKATPVWISSINYPLLEEEKQKGALWFPSFTTLLSS